MPAWAFGALLAVGLTIRPVAALAEPASPHSASRAPSPSAKAGGSRKTAGRVSVRASVSNRGAERLGGLRVVRLLEIELGERTPLSPRATGPLGGDVIWVWIDAPTPRVVLIEVRRFDRPVTRRNLAIKEMPSDVAARLVAIVTSEMVRAQARASLSREVPKPTPSPSVTSQAEAESSSAMVLSTAMRALWLPTGAAPLLAGAEIALAHRLGNTSQRVYGSWLSGPSWDDPAGMLEVGAAVDLRLRLSDTGWRLRLGGQAGAAQLWLPGAHQVDGVRTDRGWTGRVAATAAVGVRLGELNWLELAVSPGALLHTVEAEDRAGRSWSMGGFALDTGLGLVTDFGLGETPAAPHGAPSAMRGVDSNR